MRGVVLCFVRLRRRCAWRSRKARRCLRGTITRSLTQPLVHLFLCVRLRGWACGDMASLRFALVLMMVLTCSLALVLLVLPRCCSGARALPIGFSKGSSTIVVGVQYDHRHHHATAAHYDHHHQGTAHAAPLPVRVFQRAGASYDVVELRPPAGAEHLLFGHSVAVSESGETIVIGAPSHAVLASPSALVKSASPSAAAAPPAPPRASVSALSLSSSAHRIVIGEMSHDHFEPSSAIMTRDNGRVFVVAETRWSAEALHELADASELALANAGRAFVFFGTRWRSLVELKPPPPLPPISNGEQCGFVSMASFGSAVAVAELPSSSAFRPQRQLSVVAVGEPNGVLGAVYVFYGREWHSLHSIRPIDTSDATLAANFGAAVALSAGAKVLAVGSAPRPPDALLHRSAVFIRYGPDWGYEARLRLAAESPTPPLQDQQPQPQQQHTALFGSLALSDNGRVAVVHVRQHHLHESANAAPEASGAALVLHGQQWSQQTRVVHVSEPPDFGCFISLDASVLVIGNLR